MSQDRAILRLTHGQDAQETVITVEAENQHRTLRVTDPIGAIKSKSLREFITLVRDQADRMRQEN
jgi:hypothetical protein